MLLAGSVLIVVQIWYPLPRPLKPNDFGEPFRRSGHGEETGMPDHHSPSDEIPVADALEQEQETAPMPSSYEQADPPMEADPSDWREQLEEVVTIDDDDREEYPQ
jgi:hypothetical protein